MDLGLHTNITEVKYLIGMVHHNRYMWPIRSYVFAPLTEAYICPKGRKALRNDKVAFKELKHIVSADTMLNYTY